MRRWAVAEVSAQHDSSMRRFAGDTENDWHTLPNPTESKLPPNHRQPRKAWEAFSSPPHRDHGQRAGSISWQSASVPRKSSAG
jgi:hypothetical protein